MIDSGRNTWRNIRATSAQHPRNTVAQQAQHLALQPSLFNGLEAQQGAQQGAQHLPPRPGATPGATLAQHPAGGVLQVVAGQEVVGRNTVAQQAQHLPFTAGATQGPPYRGGPCCAAEVNQNHPGVAPFLAAFPGALHAQGAPAEGPWGRGGVAWRRWTLEAIDRQIAEYRAAGGADNLPPDPEKFREARADCPQARVVVKRAGTRVLMFTRVNGRWRRVRPFASPYLAHSMRTAEKWYGLPERGWTLTGRGGRQAHREALTGAVNRA